MNVIDNIKGLRIPMKSVGEAVRFIGSKYEAQSKSQYDSLIKEVTGEDVITHNTKEAEILFGYCIQIAVTMHSQGADHLKADDVLPGAQIKTATYLKNNPWVIPSGSAVGQEDGTVEMKPISAAASSSTKKRTGPSKKDLSVALFNKDDNKTKTRAELIQIFVKELGMTPAGASTYVHNCQKGLWK